MRAAKSAAVVLAVLLVTMHLHAGFPLIAGYGVAVPVPVLVLLAELGACAVLDALIARTAEWHPLRPLHSLAGIRLGGAR